MTSLVVVTAGLSVPSSTRILADLLAEASASALTAAGAEVAVHTVELRPLAHALADNLLTGFPSGELAEALERVRTADALVVVTPVFSASYSGLFKMFFDVLERDSLAGLPVVVAATAGTARHSLVLDHALRPLFAYLRATVVPTGVFAASEDFGRPGLRERADRAAGELAALVVGASRVLPSRVRQRTEAERFADPTPFHQLLDG